MTEDQWPKVRAEIAVALVKIGDEHGFTIVGRDLQFDGDGCTFRVVVTVKGEPTQERTNVGG